MEFASIILAAGEGSRIGRSKANLPFGKSGQTFLAHLISIYLDSDVGNIYVITGNWEKETVAASQNFSSAIKFVNNDKPEMGMFSSVCKGVSQLADIDFFFVHPVDMPLVKEETILKMKKTIMRSKNNTVWLAPEYNNEEGHPVLLPSSMIPELLNWKGENGLHGFLSMRKHGKMTEYVNDEGTIFDIDDQEDFLKFIFLVSSNS